MALETHTIPTWTDCDVDGAPVTLEVVEALQDFGRSRATRLLVQRGEESKVHCQLRVPLLRDCRVRPDELGRVLRKVWRAAIDEAEPGDRFVVDIHLGPDSLLVVQAARAS